MLDLAGLVLLWLVAREEQAPAGRAAGRRRHRREARSRRAGGRSVAGACWSWPPGRPGRRPRQPRLDRPGRRRAPRREPRASSRSPSASASRSGLGGVRVLDADGRPGAGGRRPGRRRGGGGRPAAGPARRHLRRQLPGRSPPTGTPCAAARCSASARATSTPARSGGWPATPTTATWEVVGAVGRGLAYAGVLLAAGGVAFLVLVHRGGAERARLRAARAGRARVVGAARRRWSPCPCRPPSAPARARRRSSTTACSPRWPRTAWGSGCVLALVGLVVAVVAASTAQPAVALAGAAVAAGSFATNGHTRAGSNVALATVADVTHLLGRGGVGRRARAARGAASAPARGEADRADTVARRRSVLDAGHRRRSSSSA